MDEIKKKNGVEIQSPSGAGNVDAFIGKGCKISGNLTFTGRAELDGEVEGEVHAKEPLVIGEAAVVTAKISGTDVLVRGTVNGDIFASKSLTLKRPAKIVGNISSPLLTIEEGVIFEGKCSMAGSSQENK